MRFFDESARERAARVSAMTLPAAQPRYQLLIVGTGMIGREHIRVAQLLGEAGVRAIVDTHQESIDLALELFRDSTQPPPTVYPSIEEAMADRQVDAVFICTPNYSHYKLIQQLAASGLPLFIEKPMATTLTDASKIVELEQNYPAFIQIGMQYRFKSQYTEAFFQAKKNKALGTVKTISMSEYRPPFLDKVGQWNKFNDYSGGTLVEKCCHYFDLINLMAESRPHSVYASGGQAVNFLDFEYQGKTSDIHDHGFVIIDYDNGLRANFTLNMFCQELYEELIVSGDNGRLVASESSSFRRREPSQGLIRVEVEGHADYQPREVTYPAFIERSGHHGATFFEHEAFIARLDGNPADSATPLQGLWAMIVAIAAQESIRQGTKIAISDYLKDNNLHDL